VVEAFQLMFKQTRGTEFNGGFRKLRGDRYEVRGEVVKAPRPFAMSETSCRPLERPLTSVQQQVGKGTKDKCGLKNLQRRLEGGDKYFDNRVR